MAQLRAWLADPSGPGSASDLRCSCHGTDRSARVFEPNWERLEKKRKAGRPVV